MFRSVLLTMYEWKKKNHRKPLLLRGARQVGKTWIVREFSKEYTSFVEINLEESPELIPLFDQYFGKPEKLIQQLSLVLNVTIDIQKTLLFIDEIQESTSALMSLRYFYEKLKELNIIAAGSLLEFAIKEISFPVGRIEFLYVFPMNFFEYLIAIGEDGIVKYLETKDSESVISNSLHEKIKLEVRNYCFIGGMPESVKMYIETGDFRRCFQLQNDLINNFRFDFNKYASRTKVQYLKLLFDSIPKFFSKKFVYSNISTDIKSRELGEALQLLSDAGLIYYCYHSSGNGAPLSSEVNLKKFKIYFLDIGLALKILGFSPKDLPTTSLNELTNQGGIMEQFVGQELVSRTEKGEVPQLYYWQREALNASAEIDFLISRGTSVVPVEVKSGKQRISKSLGLFINEKKSKKAIYISNEPFLKINNSIKAEVINLPFYSINAIFSDSQ